MLENKSKIKSSKNKEKQTEKQKILSKYCQRQDDQYLKKITENDEEQQDGYFQHFNFQQFNKDDAQQNKIKYHQGFDTQNKQQKCNLNNIGQIKPSSVSSIKARLAKQQLNKNLNTKLIQNCIQCIKKNPPIKTDINQKQYNLYQQDNIQTENDQCRNRQSKKQQNIPKKLQIMTFQPDLVVDLCDFVNIVQMANYPPKQKSPMSKNHNLINFDNKPKMQSSLALSYEDYKMKQKTITLSNNNTCLFSPVTTPINTPKNTSRVSQASNQLQHERSQKLNKIKMYNDKIKTSENKNNYQFAHIQSKFNHRYNFSQKNDMNNQCVKDYSLNNSNKYSNSFSLKNSPENYKTIDMGMLSLYKRSSKEYQKYKNTTQTYQLLSSKQSTQLEPQAAKSKAKRNEDSTLSISLQTNINNINMNKNKNDVELNFGNQAINFKNSLVVSRQKQGLNNYEYINQIILEPKNQKIKLIYQNNKNILQATKLKYGSNMATNLINERKSLPVRNNQMHNFMQKQKQKQFETRFKKYELNYENYASNNDVSQAFQNNQNKNINPFNISTFTHQQQLGKKIIKLNKDKNKDKDKTKSNLNLSLGATKTNDNNSISYVNSHNRGSTQPYSIQNNNNKIHKEKPQNYYLTNYHTVNNLVCNPNIKKSKYQKSQNQLTLNNSLNTNHYYNDVQINHAIKPMPTQRYYIPKHYHHNSAQSQASSTFTYCSNNPNQQYSSMNQSISSINNQKINQMHGSIPVRIQNRKQPSPNINIKNISINPYECSPNQQFNSNNYHVSNMDKKTINNSAIINNIPKKINLSSNTISQANYETNNSSCISSQIKQSLMPLFHQKNNKIISTNQPNPKYFSNQYNNGTHLNNNTNSNDGNLYTIICGSQNYKTICQENKNYEVELLRKKYKQKQQKQKQKQQKHEKIVNINKLNNTTFHFYQTPSKKNDKDRERERERESNYLPYNPNPRYGDHEKQTNKNAYINTNTQKNQQSKVNMNINVNKSVGINYKRDSNVIGKIKNLSQSFEVKTQQKPIIYSTQYSSKKPNTEAIIGTNIKTNKYIKQNENMQKIKIYPDGFVNNNNPICNKKNQRTYDNLNIAVNKTNNWLTINNIISPKNIDGFNQSICLDKMETIQKNLRQQICKTKNNVDNKQKQGPKSFEKDKNKNKDKICVNLLQNYQQNYYRRPYNGTNIIETTEKPGTTKRVL